MGRGLRPWRQPKLSSFVLMASTASALSLANFQVITNNQVPTPCIATYNGPIAGCQSSDFTNGRQCSATCTRGLQSISIALGAVCGNAQVDSKSLLGIALSGGIVQALCPGFGAPAASKTTPAQITTPQTTALQPPPTIPAVPTSIPQIDTSEGGDDDTPTSSVPSVTTSPVLPIFPTNNPQTFPTQITTTPTQLTSTQQTSIPDLGPGITGGGGSPFDAQAQVSGSYATQTFHATQAIMVALATGLFMLQ